MTSGLKVLVTGGAGFIGSALTKKLTSQGINVVVLDDFSTGLTSNILSEGVEVIRGSIVDRKTVTLAAKSVDAIVHLAARGSVPRSIRNPTATFDVNVMGTLNICEVAKEKNIPIIFSSSSSVYGANIRLKKVEEDWLSPLSPYAASKLSGEATVISFARSFGIKTAVFRLFNVYGPGQRPEHQYSAVIPKWIWSALRGKELKIFGDGQTSRDFTYIDNVVEILCTCLLEGRYFDGATNLAFGNPVTLLDVIHEIRKYVPTIHQSFQETRVGDIRNSDNGSQRVHELFPEIQPISLQEGIKETSKWLENMRMLIESHPLEVSDD
jgi:UDP-glucose 4-epimerase